MYMASEWFASQTKKEGIFTMCDFNLITRKLISAANKKVCYQTACDIAQEAILACLEDWNEDKGIAKDKFIWVCYRNKLADHLRKVYVRKANSLDYYADNADGNNLEIAGKIGNSWDMLVSHLQECLEESIITQDEYNILILKGMGEETQAIAYSLNISAGRVSQIFGEAKEKVSVS